MTKGGLPGIGIVGAGVAARVIHIPAIRDSVHFDLVAVCDTNEASLNEPALDGVERYADLDGLVADQDVIAAVVCTPPDSHFDITYRLLEAGKHVLVEKPLTRTSHESNELIRLAAAKGVELRVAHERRFQPTVERIRELIQEGAIGEPFFCGVHWGTNVKLDPDRFVPGDDAGGGFRDGYLWRWSSPHSGGGVLQDHIPHYVDLLRDWTGQEPIAVQADIINVARDHIGWPAEESRWEDFGVATVRFSEGLRLRLECSVVGRVMSPLLGALSGIGEWAEWGYILGSRGQLVFDFPILHASENGRIAVWRVPEAGPGGTGWTMIEQPEPNRTLGTAPSGAAKQMFVGQIREFANAVEGKANRSPSGYDGAVCVAVTEAAYEAAASGATAKVALSKEAVS